MDVLLELADGLGGEGVRDGLAFAGVLGSIAGVEEAAADGDEGVVVFTVEQSRLSVNPKRNFTVHKGLQWLQQR